MPRTSSRLLHRRRPLRAGELVEVRSKEEILATLDRSGALDGLPFMPEMLGYCGQPFSVAKRADKTCDTVKDSGLRRMTDTVHLEGTRCDGSAHEGCQAACQIFWKEDWLRRISERGEAGEGNRTGRRPDPAHSRAEEIRCTEEELRAATRRAPSGDSAEVTYRCQATDLREASTPLPSWWPMQYVRDIRSGNAGVGEVVRAIVWQAARWARGNLRGYRIQVRLFNLAQRLTGGTPLMPLEGEHRRTPAETLELVPGDVVQVKSLEEIRETLDPNQRNRGLYFDQEMTPFCGGTFTVRSRVSQIIHDKTGRLITIPGDCVILESVFCTGRYHKCCPRAIYPYWREVWLRRVPGPGQSGAGPA